MKLNDIAKLTFGCMFLVTYFGSALIINIGDMKNELDVIRSFGLMISSGAFACAWAVMRTIR